MLRTRWIGGFALLFLLLITGFAWFGTANLGIAGIQDFSRTTISLVNFICAVVPLMALIIGVYGFSIDQWGEELLFSQPISRAAIVAGKALGLLATLTAPTLIGFGFAGSIIAFRVGIEGIAGYLAFALLTVVLQTTFLSLALLLSSLVHRRMRAIGAALGAWIFFVVIYDLLVIGLTLVFRGAGLQKALFLSVFLNPVDMMRVSQLIILGGKSFFGPTGAAWMRFLGGEPFAVVLIGSATALWILIPAVVGLASFSRRDL